MPRPAAGLTLYPRSRARPSSQRARPVAHLGGVDRRRRPAQHARSRPARRRLGYGRYWVAEHHGTPMLACASPEVLIGPIAAGDRAHPGRQRRRDAAPLQPAQGGRDASASSAGLYPGRIDLGIGRAPGTDRLTMLALQRDRRQPSPDDFPEQLTELLAYLEDGLPAGPPLRAARARCPARPSTPEVWLLGSSPQSAIWAAELGPPLLLRRLHQPGRRRDRGRATGERFRQPSRAEAPLVVAVVGDLRRDRRGGRAARGQRPDGVHAAAPGSARSRCRRSRRRCASSRPRESGAASVRAARRDRLAGHGARGARGGRARVRRRGADVVTITHDHAARRRSYELIAEAFGLDAAGTAPAATGAQP